MLGEPLAKGGPVMVPLFACSIVALAVALELAEGGKLDEALAVARPRGGDRGGYGGAARARGGRHGRGAARRRRQAGHRGLPPGGETLTSGRGLALVILVIGPVAGLAIGL